SGCIERNRRFLHLKREVSVAGALRAVTSRTRKLRGDRTTNRLRQLRFRGLHPRFRRSTSQLNDLRCAFQHHPADVSLIECDELIQLTLAVSRSVSLDEVRLDGGVVHVLAYDRLLRREQGRHCRTAPELNLKHLVHLLIHHLLCVGHDEEPLRGAYVTRGSVTRGGTG